MRAVSLFARRLALLPFEWLTVDEMFDQGSCVGLGQVRVPVAVRVDDRVRAVETRAEATARGDSRVGTARDQKILHRREQGRTAVEAARGLAAVATICAHKQVA